jgi:hypothetical protein
LRLEFAGATLQTESIGSCDELKSFCNKTSDADGIVWLLADKLDGNADARGGAGRAGSGRMGAGAFCMDGANAGFMIVSEYSSLRVEFANAMSAGRTFGE